MIMAPNSSQSLISYFRVLVYDFMELFVKLMPDIMNPKVHMLTHYPRLMMLYGPLRQLWCMMFEGKHGYFKRIAQTMCNFKNPCMTLSSRHQLLECWHLRSRGYVGESVTSHWSVKTVAVEQLTPTLRERLTTFLESTVHIQLPYDAHLQRVNRLLHDSVAYSVGDFFVIDLVCGENVPVFMKILHIFGFRGLWYICGQVYSSAEYVGHKHAYRLENSKHWNVMVPGQERDYHALDAYTDENDDSFVTLQHTVLNV